MGNDGLFSMLNETKQQIDGMLGIVGILSPDQIKDALVILNDRQTRLEKRISQLESKLKIAKPKRTRTEQKKPIPVKKRYDDDDY